MSPSMRGLYSDASTLFLKDLMFKSLGTVSIGSGEELTFNVIINDLVRYIVVDTKEYEVILHPDLDEGGYWVECPAMPGCASQGETEEEALEMIKESIELMLGI